MGAASETGKKSHNISAFQAILPWLLFALLALGAFAAFQLPVRHAAALRQAAARKNEALGLPQDYPLTHAPLYQGINILSCKKSDTTSKDGAAMDEWDLSAESDAPAKDIFEFYKSFCSGRDMLQTQMISIPTGYSMDYANENEIIHLETERPTGKDKTTLKLTYYVIAKKS